MTDGKRLLQEQVTEAAFQSQVLAHAKLMGWEAHWTRFSIRSPDGWLDLYLSRERDGREVFAELKTMRGKQTAGQARWLMHHARCGREVYLWRPDYWHQIEEKLR